MHRRPGRANRVIALVLLSVVTASCDERELVNGLDSVEAQRCAVVLRAAGLDVEIRRDDGATGDQQRLLLRGDDAAFRSALQVLAEHALPRRAAPGFSTGHGSLIPSPSEDRARFLKGLSGEIEALLESIDGVVSAEVLVSIPVRRPLESARVDKASASVVIAHSGEASPVNVEEVRAVVVRSVGSAITGEDVTVVLKPVIRTSVTQPIVRYHRDRITEVGFVLVVVLLAGLEFATLWRLRAVRLRAHGAGGGDREA